MKVRILNLTRIRKLGRKAHGKKNKEKRRKEEMKEGIRVRGKDRFPLRRRFEDRERNESED